MVNRVRFKILMCAVLWPAVASADQYAFLVGVRDYSLNQELTSLKFCEDDVHTLASTLFKNSVPLENIVLMSQRMAVKSARYSPRASQIRKEFDLVLAELEPEDTIIVAFSGHGLQFKDDPVNYFCPLDAVVDDKTTLISLTEIYDKLNLTRATSKLLLVDACRDDPLTGIRKTAKRIELEAVTERRPPVFDGGTVALFSCSATQQSFESPDLKSGVFFHFINRALAGEADSDDDLNVDLLELESFTIKNVQKWTRVEIGQKQTPERRGDSRGAVTLVRLPARAALPPTITNSIGMKLNLIPAGEFLMGSGISAAEVARRFDSDDKYFTDEHPQHRVRITQPFYMATTEVTQGQWEAVMGTTPWSGKICVKEGNDYAASYISWDDAVEYCRRLSAKDGRSYRLPTEAEWEYACRAKGTSIYSFGDSPGSLKDYAWFNENARDVDETYAHLVGQKRPNAFGLYDMHGNVWEWCSDRYGEDYYATSPSSDPAGPTTGSPSGDPADPRTGSSRVFRGGSWNYDPQGCRSASRNWLWPTGRDHHLGFRVSSSVLAEPSK